MSTVGRRRRRVVILRARASTRASRGARAAGERRFASPRASRATAGTRLARVRVVECDGERDATRRRRKTARAAPRAMTTPSRERARASKATPAASARGARGDDDDDEAREAKARAPPTVGGDGAARDDAKRKRGARASGGGGAKANDDDGFDVDALFGDAKKRSVKMNSGAREAAAAAAAAAAEAPRVRVLLPGQKKPKQKRDKPEFTPVDKPRRFEDGLPVYKSYGDFSDMKAGQCDDGEREETGTERRTGWRLSFRLLVLLLSVAS